MGNLTSQEWKDVLDKFDRSGLTIDIFCKQNKINKGTFYHWKGKIKNLPKEIDRNDFLEVKPKSQEPVVNKSQLKIYMPSGITLNFYTLPDCDYLERLMKKMRSSQ